MIQFDKHGREIPDPTPMELPLGYERPEPLEHMIARMIQANSRLAAKQGLETEEEANDFEIDDDDKLVSKYEFTEMQEEHINAERDKARTARAERIKAAKGKKTAPEPEKSVEEAPELVEEAQ